MKINKAAFVVCFICLLAGCNPQSAGHPESGDEAVMPAPPAQENLSSTESIATDKLLGAPLYKNPARGAAHMMRASDGFYYAYDGDADFYR